MPNVVFVAIILFTLILKGPKTMSTNMLGCSLIYDLFFISYLVVMFFKEIFSTKTFLSKIFSSNVKYVYDNESINCQLFLYVYPILSQRLWIEIIIVCLCEVNGLANRTRMPSYDIDNFSELSNCAGLLKIRKHFILIFVR